MAPRDFEFVPAARGTWTLAARDLATCNEEAAHAVVACLMGLEIHEARMDSPDVEVAGHVLLSTDRGDIRSMEDIHRGDYKRLLAVLAGPVFIRSWESFRWPLDEHAPGDVGMVARYCRWLGYELVNLFMAEQRVKALLEDKRVRKGIKAVGSELLEQGAIRGSRVYELVADANVADTVTRKAMARVPRATRGAPR